MQGDADSFKQFNLQYVTLLPWNNRQVGIPCSLASPSSLFPCCLATLSNTSPYHSFPDCPTLPRLALFPAPHLPFPGPQDELNMLALLENGTLSALILDAPFVEYNVATSCELYSVGSLILPNSLCFQFPPDAPMVRMGQVTLDACVGHACVGPSHHAWVPLGEEARMATERLAPSLGLGLSFACTACLFRTVLHACTAGLR